jgi:murein L,D-transpeptidase YcbB/YkuD
MTTTERKFSNFQKHDFAKDSLTFGRLDVILDTVKFSTSDELLRAMSLQVVQALPNESPAPTSKDPEKLLKDTLFRIARHIRERQQQYEKFYLVAKTTIEANNELHSRHADDISNLEAALNAAKNLGRQPTDPEEVHNVLRKISTAAHQLIFILQAQNQHLQVENAALEKKNTEYQNLIKVLKAKDKTKLGEPSDDDRSLRAVMVKPETAPVLVKLLKLKEARIVYRPKMGRGNGSGAAAWIEANLCGSDTAKLLTKAELATVFDNPSLLKSFDPKLYETFRRQSR